MSTHIDYLVRRLEALRHLVTEIHREVAEALDITGDWQEGHGARLERYRQSVEALAPLRASDPGLSALSARCGLDAFDEDVLLLALAPSLDRSFGRQLSSLRRTYGTGRPDLDIILGVLTCEVRTRLEALRRFDPEAPLMRHGLLSLARPRSSSDVLAMEVHVPERVQSQLLGSSSPQRGGGPAAESPLPARRTFEDVLLPEEQRQRLVSVLDAHAFRPEALAGRGASLVLLVGASGVGKTAVAEACAAHLKRPLLRIDSPNLSMRVTDLPAAVQDFMLESRLTGALVFFDECEMVFANRMQGNRHLSTLLQHMDAAEDLIVIATQHEELLDPALRRRILLRLKLETPPPSQRLTLWRRLLPPVPVAADLDLPFIAEKYEFNGGQIGMTTRLAASTALARAASGQELELRATDLEDAAQAQLQNHLAQLAIRTITHLSLKDIVLPDGLMGVIRSIIAAVRNRRRIFEDWGFGERMTTGRGLSMLFRGDSGTGKTLTAEILGAELALPLYRIAIPRIISKYIGETEQNLEKAFREAQLAGAILLFDEADAIFTKRVEVSNSTDRYSNMEVNLLLQEMERFEGVVILTTNLDAAIDDAFERRLNYKLDFPFPDPGHRREIWRRLLPEKAPVRVELEDLEYLAERFELSGGSIKNVVIRAAYSAAECADTINIDRLEEAAIQEYRELGKLVRSGS